LKGEPIPNTAMMRWQIYMRRNMLIEKGLLGKTMEGQKAISTMDSLLQCRGKFINSSLYTVLLTLESSSTAKLNILKSEDEVLLYSS
jgi:hypothetical protein